MSDYSKSKTFGTKVYPVNAFATSDLMSRCEPLITPELLISRYLKAQTNEVRQKFSDTELKDQINLAANEFELMSGLKINKVQDTERVPFDRDLYKAFVYVKTKHGPVLSVDEMSIQSSNGENIYNLPADWIEVGYAAQRQINLVPILSIFGAAGLQDGRASNAGLIFLQAINNFQWLPSFFTIKYTYGLSNTEGQIPVSVNEVIGMIAAINILSDLQAFYRHTSTSISQDGVSQAASGPGPKVYLQRIEDLEKKRDKTMAKLKAVFSNKYFLSNI